MAIQQRPGPRTTNASVDFTRRDIVELRRHYELISDCIAGEYQVKHRKQRYLPQPNASDKSEENIARYAAYVDRAVFYNVTKRTLSGLVGQIFIRDPQIEIPTQLEVMKPDATGSGVNLIQLTKRFCNLTLAYGRAGLLCDYPKIDGGVTQAQIASGDVRPMLFGFDPWDVINWRTIVRGGREILSLVVIREKYGVHDDGFEIKEDTQYRVLRLIDNVYTVEFWRKAANASFILHEGPYSPTDSTGNTWNEIPFKFIGCNDNDTTIDHPPLFDLATLNIAHYRNSADYEEAVFICGQPTPYFAGLTESWVTQVLKGSIQLGARAAVPLPEGGTAGLLQAEANTMPKEAMDAKERQMVALGAKLVEQKTIQRTATEADLENSSETSTLSTSAKNVAEGLQWGLRQAAKFVGVDAGKDGADIRFSLNTEFDLTQMSSDERKELISEWQSNAITFGEMRASLRRAGIATETDEDALAKIKEESTLIPSILTANPPPVDPNKPPAKKPPAK